MMNATVEMLPAIRAVLPSMGAPTVVPLAEDGQIAVHAAVEADQMWQVLPALKDLGYDKLPARKGPAPASAPPAASPSTPKP